MPTKLYLAGKYNDIAKMRERIAYVRENTPFEISYDWTIRAEENQKDPNNERTIEKKRTDAVNDINGVIKADWTIAFMDDLEYVYRGTFFELGASVMRDRFMLSNRTIIIGSDKSYASDCCFYYLPEILHFDDLTTALEYIKSFD